MKNHIKICYFVLSSFSVHTKHSHGGQSDPMLHSKIVTSGKTFPVTRLARHNLELRPRNFSGRHGLLERKRGPGYIGTQLPLFHTLYLRGIIDFPYQPMGQSGQLSPQSNSQNQPSFQLVLLPTPPPFACHVLFPCTAITSYRICLLLYLVSAVHSLYGVLKAQLGWHCPPGMTKLNTPMLPSAQ